MKSMYVCIHILYMYICEAKHINEFMNIRLHIYLLQISLFVSM